MDDDWGYEPLFQETLKCAAEEFPQMLWPHKQGPPRIFQETETQNWLGDVGSRYPSPDSVRDAVSHNPGDMWWGLPSLGGPFIAGWLISGKIPSING